ncbi:MAG: hypothetical protein ACJA14_000116 [Ilumatobacter sp.]
MSVVVPEPTFARVADAVWRLAPDRVIVRRASAGSDDAGADVWGLAAMVWAALDEPGSVVDLAERLAAEELAVNDADLGTVVSQLVDAGWLCRADGGDMARSV